MRVVNLLVRVTRFDFKETSSNQFTPEQQAEIEALLALPDEEIDTQDILEVVDWSEMQRGLFYRPIEQQNIL